MSSQCKFKIIFNYSSAKFCNCAHRLSMNKYDLIYRCSNAGLVINSIDLVFLRIAEGNKLAKINSNNHSRQLLDAACMRAVAIFAPLDLRFSRKLKF